MTSLRASVQAAGGVLAGAAGTWILAVAYAYVAPFPRGELAVPCALVAVVGALLARRPESRAAGLGLVLGAAGATAFFLYVLDAWSRGLAGL